MQPGQEADIGAVPRDVLQAARDAFDGREPGTRVADLVYDSLIDGDRRFRDCSDGRRLHFADDKWSLEVAVHEEGDLLGLVIQSMPGQGLSVEVRHGGEPLHGRASDGAAVEVVGVHPGLVSLLVDVLDVPESRRTSWVRL